MSSKYWEVTGDTRKAILKVYDDQKPAIARAMALCKEVGADAFMHATLVQQYVIGFTFKKSPSPAEDSKILRKKYDRKERRHLDWYVPNLRTKEGKALKNKMHAIVIPGRWEIAEILKFDDFALPGIRTSGNGPDRRIVVETKPDYKPVTKKLKRGLTRISDIDAEKVGKRKRKQ